MAAAGTSRGGGARARMGRGAVEAKRVRLGLGRDLYRPRRGEGKRRSEELRPSMARRSPAAVTAFKGET
jgi:hypothetical protein